MVRKRRTELPGGGESSERPEASGGRGGEAQRPPPQQQQGGGYQGGGGRGWAPQPQQGGRGGYAGGRGGGGVQRGGMDLHQYDVTITPDVASRGVNRAVIKELVKVYRESHLGKRLPAYDGRKSLYTAGPLPFKSKEFRVTLTDEDDGSGAPRREREFKVVIKYAACADLHHLGMFFQGRQADAPQEALQEV